MQVTDLLPLIESEIGYASDKFGPFHSAHEQHSVLQEEVDEWFDEIKKNMADCCQYELLQIASVALRYILENGDVSGIANVQRMRHQK